MVQVQILAHINFDLLLGQLFHCHFCNNRGLFRWLTIHHSMWSQYGKAIHLTNMTMVWRLPSLPWEQGMQQPSIHHQNGFLDFNNLYTIWKEIHAQSFSHFSNSPSTHPLYLQYNPFHISILLYAHLITISFLTCNVHLIYILFAHFPMFILTTMFCIHWLINQP